MYFLLSEMTMSGRRKSFQTQRTLVMQTVAVIGLSSGKYHVPEHLELPAAIHLRRLLELLRDAFYKAVIQKHRHAHTEARVNEREPEQGIFQLEGEDDAVYGYHDGAEGDEH